MGRIVAVDYGGKRTGIAVTDPQRIIASPLDTVETPKLMKFFNQYLASEVVDLVLIGMPVNLDGSPTDATPLVKKFIVAFQKHHPNIPIEEVDERFSSTAASQAILQMGLKKMQRQEKGRVDQVAAAMMLQEYLSRLS